MKKRLFLIAPLLWGCTSQFAALRSDQSHVLEEMRSEIADVRHSLHGAEVEIKLLEERLENPTSTTDEVIQLQKKVAQLEKTLEKMNGEIRSLLNYASQTTASLSQYRDKIVEIDQKVHTRPKPSEKIYTVKSGDSLEKIARLHTVSLEALKAENNLSSDRIVVGQKLKIPQ